MSLISPPPTSAETAQPQTRPDGGAPARPAKPRLGWLDSLRGLAAATVMVAHYTQNMLPGTFVKIGKYLDTGTFGVFLFFMISGYIVPASLERKGSVRGFWVSRLFRIYPLCLVVVLGGVLAWNRHWYTTLPPVNWFSAEHPAISALGNATMLHDFLGVPGTVFVMWTLSYEMLFYLLVAALFVLRVHRRSAEFSAGFAAFAVVGAGAGLFPVWKLTHTMPHIRHAVLAVAVVMALSLVLVMVRRRAVSVVGALLLGGLAVTLLLGNSRMPGWFSMTILATMFAGNAVYRAEQGQISRLKCVLFLAVTLGAVLYVGSWYGEAGVRAAAPQWIWVRTMLTVWTVFGIGLALRKVRMPRVLTWLGSVSYSVYLVHAVVLSVVLWLVSPAAPSRLSGGNRVLVGIGFCAVVLALSQLTFRLVEQPAQRLGSRVTKLVERIGRRPEAE